MNKNKCSICNTIISGVFTREPYTSQDGAWNALIDGLRVE
jgi:hypothetical protein